ncbi:hypothetical protein MASR2M79_12440 [Aminivibrio sp.]
MGIQSCGIELSVLNRKIGRRDSELNHPVGAFRLLPSIHLAGSKSLDFCSDRTGQSLTSKVVRGPTPFSPF